MNPKPICGDNSKSGVESTKVAVFEGKNIEFSSDGRSSLPPANFSSTSLKNREASIQKKAVEMRKTASKRSKTILAVGLVAGAIAGIVGGAMALAGIVTMIPFIIAGISVFAGIIFSIASLPETEQMYEARLTVEYAKKALISDNEKKVKCLNYLNNILATTENIGDKEFYLYEERNNLLRLAVKAILVENKEEIISCLNNNDSGVKSSAITLLTKAISRKDLSKEAGEIFNKDNATIFVKNCLNCSDDKVIIETFNLLGKMIESEDSLMKEIVNSALTENKEGIYDCLINGSKDVKNSAIALLNKAKIENLSENEKRIQGLLNGKELTDIQGDELLIIKIMLYSKDSNVSKTGINVLTNIINKSKDTAKKLFGNGILDLGIVKKMIHNGGTKDEMLNLLASMSKDKDLKNVVVDLVGSDIIDKLTKLNPKSTTEEKNKIIEEIKGLSLGIPTKLNAGDIVYKDSHDFGEKLTILQQSEENIKKANELKEIFKNQENENELKNRFSKNDGLRYEDGKIQGCFLQDDKHDFNKETNKIDSKKVANQAIRDLSSGNLFSIKCNANNHIRGQNDTFDNIEKDIRSVLVENETKKCDSECIKFIKNNVKDVKDTINTLCSFPGQATGFTISNVINGKKFVHSQISIQYSVVVNDNGTIDVTTRSVYYAISTDNPKNQLPVAIEEKTVFRLNKQEKDEYVPITPLEAQVNVYDADVLVEDKEYKNKPIQPLALRIREKITSIDWKNDEVKNNK